ncbi:MAG: aminoglycoside phosphotransferase family protein [Acidobacteria bacterium]|nr:aminoglycoside phosphotransferase family protein [Acidobacteriota bacterium]
MVGGTPPAEVALNIQIVRHLLDRQFPQYRHLELQEMAPGWDNAMYRLGPDLAVRLPRRKVAAPLIQHEMRWLPELAQRLPLPIPAPLHLGDPDETYPFPWLIVPWLSGTTANVDPPRPDQAEVLVSFLKNLHVAAGPDLATNPFRSVGLESKVEVINQRLARIRQFAQLDPRLLQMWQRALNCQPSHQRTWIHGDLHARNVLVQDGQFSAVVDWGDIATGDPAVDLAGIWSLFPDREARAACINGYGTPDPDFWLRAKGWVFYVGIVLVDSGAIDHPEHLAMGWNHLNRLLEDESA